jgi:hypothetical protein
MTGLSSDSGFVISHSRSECFMVQVYHLMNKQYTSMVIQSSQMFSIFLIGFATNGCCIVCIPCVSDTLSTMSI